MLQLASFCSSFAFMSAGLSIFLFSPFPSICVTTFSLFYLLQSISTPSVYFTSSSLSHLLQPWIEQAEGSDSGGPSINEPSCFSVEWDPRHIMQQSMAMMGGWIGFPLNPGCHSCTWNASRLAAVFRGCWFRGCWIRGSMVDVCGLGALFMSFVPGMASESGIASEICFRSWLWRPVLGFRVLHPVTTRMPTCHQTNLAGADKSGGVCPGHVKLNAIPVIWQSCHEMHHLHLIWAS